MNQTRTFLLLALAAVAYLLFNQWMHEFHPPAPKAPPAPAASVAHAGSASVPAGTASAGASRAGVPSATASAAESTTGKGNGKSVGVPAGKASAHGQLIKVRTDVLALTIDTRGGTVIDAHLLGYPETIGSTHSVQLLNDDPKKFYEAQSGLIGIGGAKAPSHKSLFHAEQTRYVLSPGQKRLQVQLDWTGPDGVTVRKTYTLTRGSYAVAVAQTIRNQGDKTWRGQAYHQLERVKPSKSEGGNFLKKYAGSGKYGFFGAAWYAPGEKFNKVKFKDIKDHPLADHGQARKVTGGWIAMEQTYFVGAWLRPDKQAGTFSTAKLGDGDDAHYLIRAIGPALDVAPGKTVTSKSRLFVGPKLPAVLKSVEPSFHLALNYGFMTVIARPLHGVLSALHSVTGNWGWAIVLLVVLINVVIYKFNAMQYRSSARMRQLKPRLDALKERYGDDKQKLQQATMELYKKEKVNPVSGCLPVLITLPIFFGLYELLRQSVELRQAPFIFWIHDLSVADPYFVMPVLYAIVMLIQSMTMPLSPGMDGTQQKFMRYMPVGYAVLFAFFPAGLALYYVVNTICRLLTQWWVYRQVDQQKARKKAVTKKA